MTDSIGNQPYKYVGFLRHGGGNSANGFDKKAHSCYRPHILLVIIAGTRFFHCQCREKIKVTILKVQKLGLESGRGGGGDREHSRLIRENSI